MTPELFGIPYRSNPETYSLGNAITFKMDFMANARSMAAPEVWQILICLTGTVGAVSGGALGRDAAKTIDTVRFRDTQEMVNASGAGLRVLEQMEMASRQRDPDDIASGATNTAYRYILRLVFANPWRAERDRDTAVPLAHFLEGGEFTVVTPAAVPTGWAAVQNDWKLQLFADIRDGRKRELKTRRRIKEERISNLEFDYQINGFMRSAILTSKLATTGYSSWASHTTLNSKTLMVPPAYQVAMLLDQYRRESYHLGTNDEFALATPGAIPLVMPRRYQKIGKMVDTKSLHIELPTTIPTNAIILTDTIVDRDGDMAALSEGYRSSGDLHRAVMQNGKVKGKAGNYHVRNFAAPLARKLPIEIAPGGVDRAENA